MRAAATGSRPLPVFVVPALAGGPAGLTGTVASPCGDVLATRDRICAKMVR